MLSPPAFIRHAADAVALRFDFRRCRFHSADADADTPCHAYFAAMIRLRSLSLIRRAMPSAYAAPRCC